MTNVLKIVRSAPETDAPADDGLAAQLMELIIAIRADARKTKNFGVSDAIRAGLTKLNVVLEDRPEGTTWKRTN
jgi:cysteinyl-tRNA synthetase